MKYTSLALLPLVPVLLVACATAPTSVVKSDPGYGIAERGRELIGDSVDVALLAGMTLDYINLFRARYNLPRVNADRTAALAAQWMAGYQARHSRVTHEATDVPSMRVFPLRYRAVGGETYARGGENAGWYRLYDTDSSRVLTYDEMARRIVDGWINSPSHRRILLSHQGLAEGTIGIGIARGTYQDIDGIYSTMNVFFPWPDQTAFAAPRTATTSSRN